MKGMSYLPSHRKLSHQDGLEWWTTPHLPWKGLKKYRKTHWHQIKMCMVSVFRPIAYSCHLPSSYTATVSKAFLIHVTNNTLFSFCSSILYSMHVVGFYTEYLLSVAEQYPNAGVDLSTLLVYMFLSISMQMKLLWNGMKTVCKWCENGMKLSSIVWKW